MFPLLIVLAGPPLPGRWALARAIERRTGARRFHADRNSVPLIEIVRALDGGCVLVDGDLATREERAEVLDLGSAECRRVLVEWRCERKQAEREVFHRYASRPRVLASAELDRYLEDARVREPVRDAPGRTVVRVDAAATLDEQLERVLRALPAEARAGGDQRTADPRRRVLVVEDDAEERAILADVLTELGFAVEQAPDAGVAMALLDEGAKVDLLISDQQMPGMSGIELAREVGRRHAGVRTVLLTAFSDEELCRRAVEAHAVTVLAKPLRVIDLERVLEESAA
ncbi:MAG: response regulator [Polyangia bacterium]